MESSTACLISLSLFLFAFYWFFKCCFDYWKKKGVYTETPLFVFGNAKNLIIQKCSLSAEFANTHNHLKEKLLDFGGYYFLTKPILVPVDLDLIKKILITDFEHFTDHSLFVQEYEPLSQHLFALKGSQWKAMRAKLTPAFTTSKNKMLFGTVLQSVDQLLKIIDEASEKNVKVDVRELASKFSIDVISSCAFGFDSKSLNDPNSKIQSIVTKFFQPSIRNSILLLLGWVAPNILSFFKLRFYRKAVSDFFIDLITETVKYRETNKVTRSDFVDLLIQIRNSAKSDGNDVGITKPQLTMLEMAGHCLNFFLAGYETSSITLMHCLYELAINLEVQKKARDEIQKSFKENAVDDKLNYAMIQSLSYLDKVVQETMRKYPPFPILMRECTKDYVIPNTNVKIDKGCLVFISSLGIQRDPDIYPNPEIFDPERFSSDGIKNRHPCTWMPFGLGPRTCIAYQFGLMQIKIATAALLLSYRIDVNSKTQIPLKQSRRAIMMMPNDEIWLHFRKLDELCS